MYLPPQFREERPHILREFAVRCPFGTLIAVGPEGPVADHVPFVVRGDDRIETLHCHVARANPAWRMLEGGGDVLVIFQAEDAYISPSWYPSKVEDARVVPTWNYAVVHVRGRARTIEDAGWLREHVAELTDLHESTFSEPWAVTDAPADYIEAMLRGVVGIEITPTEVLGKWKVGQNRRSADREGAADRLADTGAPDAAVVARWMRDVPPGAARA